MVAYSLRFNRVARRLKSWLEAGRIGDIAFARLHVGSYLPRRHPWEDYREGYGARRELGGGVILDAIHELDASLWYLGEPDRLFCMAGRFGDLEIDVEDTAEILLEYGQCCASIHLDYLEAPPRRVHEVIGTEGKLVADLFENRCVLYAAHGDEIEMFEGADERNDEYLREIGHFLACLERRATPPVDAVAASRSLALAVAAKKSAELRSPVALANHGTVTTG
jgi:predicted dehydrogenase